MQHFKSANSNAVCDKISSGFSHTSSVTIIIHLCFGIRIANLKLFKHLGAFLSLDYVQVYPHILFNVNMVPNKMHSPSNSYEHDEKGNCSKIRNLVAKPKNRDGKTCFHFQAN